MGAKFWEVVCDENGIGGSGEDFGDNDSHLGRINLPTQQGFAALHKISAEERLTKKANLLLHSPTPALTHAPPNHQANCAPTRTSALFTF
jgi:hypothetical protein